VEAADRAKVEHRVEGRDLVGPDVGHAEIFRDIFDHRDGQPALRLRLRPDLALGEVEQRDDRALLPPGRIRSTSSFACLSFSRVKANALQRARTSSRSMEVGQDISHG
jgi:hypothetical protein